MYGLVGYGKKYNLPKTEILYFLHLFFVINF